MCTKYLHIATLLMNLPISTKMNVIFPELESLYENLNSEYSYRLPFWKLLSEPWSLLEPLMIADSDIGPKLSPLCPFLNIDRDDFYVKRAVHLYTRSSLQSNLDQSLESTTPNTTIPTTTPTTTTLSPQMESLLKDIDDIASCTKKPLTRVKIWRLVYEMEKERNSNIALKALETALGVFDQMSAINIISEIDQQSYRDMKYEILLEKVKHQSKEILSNMNIQKLNLIQHDTNIYWKKIFSTDYYSIVNKLTPYLGDITTLLKIFFEIILEEVWVIQLHTLRKTSSILSPYEIINQKLLPVVNEYLKYVGDVAIKLYEIHLTLENCSNEKKEENITTATTNTNTNILTSSILQSVRHSLIGKLLADVDVPGSDDTSRVMKSTSQINQIQSSGSGSSHSIATGLWGTISSSDSVVSPSSAEMRRREDIYRAFGIASLLATCSTSCPRSLFVYFIYLYFLFIFLILIFCYFILL